MAKPDLSLYIGRKVRHVIRGAEASEWGIELDGGVKILNKHPWETFPPNDELIGFRFQTISMSLRDTTLHFIGPNAYVLRVSFPPTYYVIADPEHGGEVYPQWDEELEKMGIPATPEGGMSSEPSEAWPEAEKRLRNSQEARVQNEASEFLSEEEGN